MGEMKMRNKVKILLAAGTAVVALYGCGGGSTPPSTVASTTTPVIKPGAPIDAEAGVGAAISGDTKQLIAMVTTRAKGTRPDPFSLMDPEKKFEEAQRQASVFEKTGGFTMDWTPPEPKQDAVEPYEAQPYRRLAGIITGDSVMAIMDTGAGTQLIAPGTKIEGTEWYVVSIDEEKAVLRRPGKAKPTEITVRLESSPSGDVMPNGGAGRGNNPGAGGGRPPAGGKGGKGGGAAGID